MDDQVGDGNAFAIPDLWKASTLAHFDEHATDSIAFEVGLLSTFLSTKIS